MASEVKDISRPFFERKPGTLGIYITIYDAVPENKSDFGSEHYYFMDLTERLFDAFSELYPAENLKAYFDEKDLLQGVVFEQFRKGVVIPVSMDDAEALERILKLSESGELETSLTKILFTPELLKKVQAKKIEPKIKTYKDEYEECMKEIKKKTVPKLLLKDRPYDQKLVKGVKVFQKTMGDRGMELKDAADLADKNRSIFFIAWKRSNFVVPGKSGEDVKTYKEFEDILNTLLSTPGARPVPFECYKNLHASLVKNLQEIKTGVIRPLSNIHAQSETNSQTEYKTKMRQHYKEAVKMIDPEYDVSKLTHPKAKFTQKETKPLIGVISSLLLVVDAVNEIDQCLDEYISGLPMDLKL